MGGFLSPWHWLFILVIAVLLFGNRLPEIARSLGRSVNEFKKGLNEVKDQLDQGMNEVPPSNRIETDATPREQLDHQQVVQQQRSTAVDEPQSEEVKTGGVEDGTH